MKVFKRICIKDFTVTDDIVQTCTIHRGHEYITSEVNDAPAIGPEPREGHVVVFTNYWIHVPVEFFAGEMMYVMR